MAFRFNQVFVRSSIRGYALKELLPGDHHEIKRALKVKPGGLLQRPSLDLPLSFASLNINNIQVPSHIDPDRRIRCRPLPLPLSRVIELPMVKGDVTYEDQIPIKSIVEPDSSTKQEKQAARLVVIRRKKMKRHKLKKLRKRLKYERAKIRQRRELQKEKQFQAMLLEHIKRAESFDPAKYAAEKIARAKEEELPRHWHGVIYPEEIIRQLMQEQEEKRKEKEADEKRRASMSPYVKDYLDKLPK